MSWASSSALRLLRTHTRTPIAPHVASQLDRFARGDPNVLREIAGSLTPDQLRGGSALSDPMPYVPSMRSDRLDHFSASERRILLLAALSHTQRLDSLLDAAAVEIDVLLFGNAAPALTIENGHVYVVDERLRAEILHLSDPFERRRAHEALARAGRRRGVFAAATWHAASALEPKNRATVAHDLVRLAEGYLTGGDPAGAQRIARAAAESSNGDIATRAWATAGLGAFWCGNLDDAESWLTKALRGSSAGSSATTSAALETIHLLRAGADGPIYSRKRTGEIFNSLVAATTNRTDRDALGQLMQVADALYVDPHLADSLQAQLFLTTSRNSQPAQTRVAIGSLSPHAEAHMVMMQVAFQSQAGDRRAAATRLSEAINRLPLVLAAGGLVASFVRILAEYSSALDEEVAEAFESVVSGRLLRYDGDGSVLGHDARVGSRAAAASQMNSGGRQDAPLAAAREPLSARQSEVLRLLAAGLSNKEIGADLRLSPRTVEVHLTQIYRKYDVRSRSELMSVLAGRERRQRLNGPTP